MIYFFFFMRRPCSWVLRLLLYFTVQSCNKPLPSQHARRKRRAGVSSGIVVGFITDAGSAAPYAVGPVTRALAHRSTYIYTSAHTYFGPIKYILRSIHTSVEAGRPTCRGRAYFGPILRSRSTYIYTQDIHISLFLKQYIPFLKQEDTYFGPILRSRSTYTYILRSIHTSVPYILRYILR